MAERICWQSSKYRKSPWDRCAEKFVRSKEKSSNFEARKIFFDFGSTRKETGDWSSGRKCVRSQKFASIRQRNKDGGRVATKIQKQRELSSKIKSIGAKFDGRFSKKRSSTRIPSANVFKRRVRPSKSRKIFFSSNEKKIWRQFSSEKIFSTKFKFESKISIEHKLFASRIRIGKVSSSSVAPIFSIVEFDGISNFFSNVEPSNRKIFFAEKKNKFGSSTQLELFPTNNVEIKKIVKTIIDEFLSRFEMIFRSTIHRWSFPAYRNELSIELSYSTKIARNFEETRWRKLPNRNRDSERTIHLIVQRALGGDQQSRAVIKLRFRHLVVWRSDNA